jgi:di-N-acetylchitobiase
VPASKLVLGVPWYGYRYPCIAGTAPDAVYCPIKEIPFRGVNCSDAAGSEHDYLAIRQLVLSGINVTRPVSYDSNTGSPFFNTVESGTVVQYWYDDPASLRPKYGWAKEKGLRGVGPYAFGMVDPAHHHAEEAAVSPVHTSLAVHHAGEEARDMWTAMDAFVNENA